MKDISINRTKNYLSQLKGSVGYKAIAMGASFLAVPLMIQYLGQEVYGVWSTLLTVLSWLVFFDLGIGNGVRNKVAEALASDDKKAARDYIATGYGIIGLIAATLMLLALVATYYVSWQVVFNTKAIAETILRTTVQLVVFFVILNFWLGIINSIAGALQKTGMTALGQMISNLAILLFIFFLLRNTRVSIIYMAIVYGFSITLSNAVLVAWFLRIYTDLRTLPRIVRAYVSPLLSFGIQFFVIQVAVLIIFATDKIFITQLLGPENVAQYDVVSKLFGVVIFAHAIVSAPLWSAYTDAYQRGDFRWINNMLKRQHLVFIVACFAVIFLGMVFDLVLKVWVGNSVRVSNELVIFVSIFTIISVWNNIYAMVSNGVGNIKLQMYTAVLAMLLNVPMTLVFVNVLNLGIGGVVLSNIFSLLFGGIALPIQIHAMIKSHDVT